MSRTEPPERTGKYVPTVSKPEMLGVQANVRRTETRDTESDRSTYSRNTASTLKNPSCPHRKHLAPTPPRGTICECFLPNNGHELSTWCADSGSILDTYSKYTGHVESISVCRAHAVRTLLRWWITDRGLRQTQPATAVQRIRVCRTRTAYGRQRCNVVICACRLLSTWNMSGLSAHSSQHMRA